MARTKTSRTLIGAGTVVVSAGAQRAAIDLNNTDGGFLTVKMVNGSVAPTAPCVCNIHVSHSVSLPATGPAGIAWKTVTSILGPAAADGIVESGWLVDQSIMCLQVEFRGATGQSTTVEASLSELTSAI